MELHSFHFLYEFHFMFNSYEQNDVRTYEQGASCKAELQDQLDHQVAVIRESHVKELLGIQEKIETVAAEVAAFNNVVDGQKAVTDKSALLHKQSAAILALEGALQTSRPFAKQYKIVQDVAAETEDALILAVLSGIPASLSTEGIINRS